MTDRPILDRVVVVLVALIFAGTALVNYLQGGLSAIAAIWICTAVLLLGHACLAPRQLLLSFRRVAWVALPVILLGSALGMTAVITWSEFHNRILPALIGGTVVAMGWFATALYKFYADEEEAQRQRRDTLFALRSEIFALVDKLDNQAIRSSADRVQALIRSGETDASGKTIDYNPFSTRESDPLAFDIKGIAIASLREATVETVLRFYAEYADMRNLIEDCRTEHFRALSAGRRAAIHEELTRRRIGTLRWGLKALVAINEELDIANPRNLKRSGQNPDINPE